MLTLDQVAKDPGRIAFSLVLPQGGIGRLRPLLADDEERLVSFFEGLSPQTKRFYSVEGDLKSHIRAHAQELCEAINRYDKLRLLLSHPFDQEKMIGIVEFSFAILPSDIERYHSYQWELNPTKDCRYGLCLSDLFQNQGIGKLLFQYAREIAFAFGKKRIILWGGVHLENAAARKHYLDCGFIQVGEFTNPAGVTCTDMIWVGGAVP